MRFSRYFWASIAFGLGFFWFMGVFEWLFQQLAIYVPPVAYFILGGSHAYKMVVSGLVDEPGKFFMPFFGASFWYEIGFSLGMFLPFVAMVMEGIYRINRYLQRYNLS